LVNIGEENNPETRVAWQNAKARAAEVGIAESTLYPSLSAAALAKSTRFGMFYGTNFAQQTIETFSPVFLLDYIIFDFGQRSEQVAVSRSNLLAANFQFNDAHRKIIFQVMQAYYRLLNSKGQQEAAEANLKNAQTVQQAAEDRLRHGLATLPDVLEARSSTAQADYDLQAAIGATEIAHGDLATALGIAPTTQFQVESIQSIKVPDSIADTVERSIDKALSQRPGLMQRVAERRAAGAEVKAAHRSYSPVLSIGGHFGLARSYGVQVHLPGVYSPTIQDWDGHPITHLTRDILSRLQAVEDFMRQIPADLSVSDHLRREVSLYSAVGTSGVRRDLLTSGYPPELNARMNVAIALVGRLVDLAAGLRTLRSTQSAAIGPADRDRCARLADEISSLRLDLQRRQLPHAARIANRPEPSELPILAEMERTAALIPNAFSGAESPEELFLPMEARARSRLFVPDMFSNPDHLKFAARGALAAMLAYGLYQAIDWPGLSTSLPACIITASSTIGSSRQQLYLRMGGTVLGGFIFGMGAQVSVFPYLDSITGFTVLFAAVTAIAGWILTATPRFSYLGVQCALIFYLVSLQEFGMQTSLAVARDHTVGILLGLLCMWAVFDRLWVGDALQAMRDAFSRNLRMLAELFEQSRKGKRQEAAMRALLLRDRIINGFNAVEAHSDAVLLEFGPSRERKLKLRNDFKRWQPTLGVLLQVQITFLQHLSEVRFPELPAKIAEAQIAFEKDMAIITQAISDDVAGKVTSAAPDVQESAAALRQEIHVHYVRSGLSIPPLLTGLITLAQNLASIVAPLYVDIHATFTNLSTP
jgi:multidrug resistance protein MdtO